MNHAVQNNGMRILILLPRDTSYYCNGIFRSSVPCAPLTLTMHAALVPEELHAGRDGIQ